MTLTEFLAARLDEDEATASDFHDALRCGSLDRDGDFDLAWCDCGWPARVLREVEAKRAMMTDIVDLIDGMDMQIEGEWGTGGTCTTGESDAVLRILAAVYSDHPDYDQEWRPESLTAATPD